MLYLLQYYAANIFHRRSILYSILGIDEFQWHLYLHVQSTCARIVLLNHYYLLSLLCRLPWCYVVYLVTWYAGSRTLNESRVNLNVCAQSTYLPTYLPPRDMCVRRFVGVPLEKCL